MRMKKFFKQLVGVALIVCCVQRAPALEIRTPLLCERGAMRYLFDFDEPKSNRAIKVWTSGYSRYASQAFTNDVGTETEELSRLIFNKSEFKVSEAFPNALVSQNSEFYNPLLRTAHLHTKIQYKERSLVLGGEGSIPVYQDKGRMGVRVRIPFRRIEVQRMDQDGVPHGADLEDVLAYGLVAKDPTLDSGKNVRLAPMMRMDFAEALVQSHARNPALVYSNFEGKPAVGGQEISDFDITGQTASQRSTRRCLGVVRSPAGLIPRQPTIKSSVVQVIKGAEGTGVGGSFGSDDILPADGNAEFGTIYRFDTAGANAGQYQELADDAARDIDERIARQKLKEELWLIPCVLSNSDISGFVDGGSMKILRDLSEQVTENAYEWLKDRGYLLESDIHAGLGDADIDVFYEHSFGDKCYGELILGMKLPTSRDKKELTGPYRAMLGNNKHWEVRLGGLFAIKPISTLNVKVDGYYAFALPKEENVFAAFRGANVKNFGPVVRATTNWSYFVARADLTMFHLKSRAISTVVGYEFYYKDKDTVIFPRNTAPTWLGRKFGTDGQPMPNEYLLDESVYTENTDSIANRCKFEASMRITDQCELYFGFGYTFAGKNAPRELDGNFGVNVVF